MSVFIYLHILFNKQNIYIYINYMSQISEPLRAQIKCWSWQDVLVFLLLFLFWLNGEYEEALEACVKVSSGPLI